MGKHLGWSKKWDKYGKEIKEEYSNGLSISEISKSYPLCTSTIWLHLKQDGIEIRPYEYYKDKLDLKKVIIDKGKLRKLYLEDLHTIKDIAKIMGCSQIVINNRLRDMGIKLRSSKSYLKLKRYKKSMREKMVKTRADPLWKATIGMRAKAQLSKSLKRYFKTHDSHTKGTKMSKESRLKLSKSLKIAMNRPEVRRKLREKRALRVIPTNDTSIEVKIQNFLKELGITFFTHQYMKEIEHSYQCDILIPSMNLVIECDGNYWHKYPTGNDIDHIRTSELLKEGFKVLRLWECEIRPMKVNQFKERLNEI